MSFNKLDDVNSLKQFTILNNLNSSIENKKNKIISKKFKINIDFKLNNELICYISKKARRLYIPTIIIKKNFA